MNAIHSTDLQPPKETLIKKVLWKLMPLFALAAATMNQCATECDAPSPSAASVAKQ